MNRMVNILKSAQFVPAWYAMLMVTFLVGIIHVALVQTGTHSMLMASAVQCDVGEARSTNTLIDVVVHCETDQGRVRSRVNQPQTVIEILRSGAVQLRCDMYVAGNVNNCVVPQTNI